MRHPIRGAAFIVAITLLLAIIVGCTQAYQAEPGRGIPATSDSTDRAEDTAMVCLALVGGTALLAGGVWIGRLRGLSTQR